MTEPEHKAEQTMLCEAILEPSAMVACKESQVSAIGLATAVALGQ